MEGSTKLSPVVLWVLGEAPGVSLPLVAFCWQGAAEGVSSSGAVPASCLYLCGRSLLCQILLLQSKPRAIVLKRQGALHVSAVL